MRLASLLFAALTLAACASVQRTLSYPATMPDADIHVGTHRYQAWFHPERPTILLQRGPPQQMGRALAQNWTVYSNDRSEPSPVWIVAADALLRPLGCHTVDLSGQDQMREATYVCVSALDMRSAIAERRAEWRQGVRVDDPTVGYAYPG